MIPLIPLTWWTISSKLSAEEAYMRLLPRLEQKSWFKWGVAQYHFPYEGSVSPRGFHINRVIRYRNSFMPMLFGNFTTEPDQPLEFQVVAFINPLVFVFLVVFAVAALESSGGLESSSSGAMIRGLVIFLFFFYIIF